MNKFSLSLFSFLFITGNLADEDKQHRVEKDTQESRHGHAAQQCDAHDNSRFGTGAGCHHQRHDPEDKRERGHQDGTKSQLRCLDGRIVKGQSLVKLYIGKFNDQDRIFGGHTDQHDERDLAKYVHFIAAAGQACQVQGKECAKNGKRCAQQNTERQRPAFILGGEHEVDHEDGEEEDEHKKLTKTAPANATKAAVK